jgi:ribosomal protein L11 methyltransferase
MAFWQLTVATAPEISDALTNFLWEQGALGVVEEESPTEPARLRAFFPETFSSGGLLHAVSVYRASLRSLGFPGAEPEPEIAPLHDDAWASAWQQSFPPRELGERILVVPPWETRTGHGAARVQIIIEPGRAFGTGHHGSTEGCLVLLEKALGHSPTPGRALDIGTGSGILAIAAVKLGAVDALAIDVDPDAIRAASLNVESNGCAGRITLQAGGPESIAGEECFPLVLANLLSHTHVALAAQYARLTAPGGSLVLGGILADEDREVIDRVEAAGFALSARLVIDGWASLSLERRARG